MKTIGKVLIGFVLLGALGAFGWDYYRLQQELRAALVEVQCIHGTVDKVAQKLGIN